MLAEEPIERGLTVEQIFASPDIRATEPIPPRKDQHEFVFRASTDDIACEGDGRSVRIRATGDLVRIAPTASDELRLSTEELARIGLETPAPRAFRPPWLDVLTVPRIRPRAVPLLVTGPMKALSLELCLSGYPWSAIGKVIVNRPGENPKVGSGVLVGPRLMLTASHGMPWGTEDGSIRFVPNYLYGNNPAFGDAYVEAWRGVVVHVDDVRGVDYVICRLDWRIGERTGWLGSEWHSDEDWYYDNWWISVGYPVASPSGGEAPSLEMPASVEDIDDDSDGLEIETDHFTSPGWSGGPLWGWQGGEPRVIGVDSGKEKDFLDPTRAVFAGGQHMVNLVKYGWANWS
jgi:V8-like Glu-specific endopeptidase